MKIFQLRAAMIGAACVLAIGGGVTVAQATTRVVLAGSGRPSTGNNYTFVHHNNGRIDNTDVAPFGTNLDWTIALPVDTTGTKTITFVGNGDGGTLSTDCKAFTINASAGSLTSGSFGSTNTTNTIMTVAMGTITVNSGDALGVFCSMPPFNSPAGANIGGRVVSVAYTP